MKSRIITSTLLAVMALLALGTTGCTTVQPWERAALADPKMNSGRDPLLTAMSEHAYFSREASSGGRGVGGSGCGCT